MTHSDVVPVPLDPVVLEALKRDAAKWREATKDSSLHPLFFANPEAHAQAQIVEMAEYASLLRDRALAEKVRELGNTDYANLSYTPYDKDVRLVRAPWRLVCWRDAYKVQGSTWEERDGATPEEALGVEEVE